MAALEARLTADARCGLHAEAEALAVCARCGTFACLACVSSVAGAVWCAACARRPVEAREDREVGVEVARVLASLAWFFPPLALVVLALVWHQRRRIRSGELAWSADWHLRRARFKAVLALVVWGLLAGALVAFFVYALASGGA